MEHKQVQVSDVRGIDLVDGIAEAIVSVTNIVDSVNDIIMPGAYKATLKKRNPKGVWSHDTNIPVAKTLRVEELMPGDPRLPQDLIAQNAGALLVKMQFNLNTSRGRDAFHDVQFFGPEQEWSIGYAVGEGKSTTDSKTGIRKIHQLELYEYSPVIFGAAPHTRTLNVKNVDDIIEEKANPKDVKVGDFVSWNSSGGTARGKIEYIMRKGTLGVPDSDFSITATPEDPAALIRVYKNTADGWEETEVLVGHKVSTLRKIDDLKEFFDIEESKAAPAIYSDIDFSIPDGVKKQAEIGLKWSKEYGRGGTSVGKNTANYLMNNSNVSPAKARHIARYFPRHAGEQSLPKNSKPGSPGYPGNGLIAWKLWGGDEGRRWSEKLVAAMNSRDEQKDVFTGSPTGTPTDFGTPQGIGVVERHPRHHRITEDMSKNLKSMISAHNTIVAGDKTKIATFSKVAQVFNRAYKANANRPDSAEHWAYAKVKSFLHALQHGMFKSAPHDTDLLPASHPMYSPQQKDMMSGMQMMQQDTEEVDQTLTPRQVSMVDAYCDIVEEFGQFNQSSGPNGAHYAENNPFVEQGLMCANCVFYEGGKKCELVQGDILPESICKLWVIRGELVSEAKADEVQLELKSKKASGGGAIPSHTTPVSDKSVLNRQAILSVRSPAEKSYYRKIFAWQEPGTDGTRKMHYKFIHHFVDKDGNPGAAAMSELGAEMAILNGGRGGTVLRGEDRKAVYNHLAHHYRDFGKTPPELKSDEELDNIMIKSGIISEPLTPKEQ